MALNDIPPEAREEGSFDPVFEIRVKEDGVWIVWPDRAENLGDPEQVFNKFADAMAAYDFGER